MNKQEIEELPEYGVDSRYKSQEERKTDSVALMEARLERMKNLPKEQMVRAKLVQLKLKMEEFLNKSFSYSNNYFTEYVAAYIDTLYSKRSEFANDISVTPVYLSQVINNHREPSQEFIFKLMVHSQKAFSKVSTFSEEMWYNVYFKQVVNNALNTEDEWRPEIEKQVKFKELI